MLVVLTGLSRSRPYILAGAGKIKFIKVGAATLVDLQSVRDYLASCPQAEIKSSHAAETGRAQHAFVHQAGLAPQPTGPSGPRAPLARQVIAMTDARDADDELSDHDP